MNKAPAPSASAIESAAEKYLPYLQEIQKKLMVIGAIFIVSAGLGFIFYQKILLSVMALFNLEGITIVLTSPYQFIDLAINTAVLIGIIGTFPVVIYYTMEFIKPALSKKEYSTIIKLLPLSIFLLASGFILGFWIMNVVISIFYKTSQEFQLGNVWDISHFYSQTLVTALSLGIVFQFPIVLSGLLHLRIIKRQLLVKSRRYIYAGCLVFAALLPPTDLLSLALITAPLVILFELTLLFNPAPSPRRKGGAKK